MCVCVKERGEGKREGEGEREGGRENSSNVFLCTEYLNQNQNFSCGTFTTGHLRDHVKNLHTTRILKCSPVP